MAKEELQNIIDKGLGQLRRTMETVTIEHDTIRAFFTKFFKTGVTYELLETAFTSLRTHGRVLNDIERVVKFPVKLRLFLSRSPKILNDKNEPMKQRLIQRLSVSFMKDNINHRAPFLNNI